VCVVVVGRGGGATCRKGGHLSIVQEGRHEQRGRVAGVQVRELVEHVLSVAVLRLWVGPAGGGGDDGAGLAGRGGP